MALNRKLLRTVLEAEGYEVLLAEDGKEALDILSRELVDAIISDILMPHIDGYRLCYEVRKDERLKDIPIIIHSASYTSPGDKRLALEFGADRFIKKSSPSSQVLTELREITSPSYRRTARNEHSEADLKIMKEYSERLIEKLEERNVQLENTKEELTVANKELLQRSLELSQSEEKFRGIIEQMQDVFFRTNRHGIIEMVSPSIERYGYAMNDLLGENLALLCADEDEGRELAEELVRRHTVSDFELTLKRQGSGTFTGSINARILKTASGETIGMEGFVRDVTERKRTEELLREQSNLAALGAEISQAAIHNETVPLMLAKCCDCLVNYLDAALTRIWTLDAQAGLLELQASAGLDAGPDHLYRRIAVGHMEIGLIAAERAPILSNDAPHDPRISCRRWAQDAGVTSFAGFPLIIEDRLLGVAAIFSRKNLSEAALESLALAANSIALGIKRKLDENALRKTEEKYRSIFESSVEGIFQTVPSGRIITANPALARILGYESPEDLIANVHNIAATYAEPGDREELLNTMETHGFSKATEIHLRRKDGARIWTLARGRAVREPGGRILYYEGTLEDVTERKQLEEQLLQAQKMEAVGRLAGGVAHDFNNLLTAIIGYSSLAASKLHADESIRHDIREIEKAGRRAANLTNQLLVFSRRQVVQPRILSLNTLVKGVDSMLKRLIGEDVILSTDLDNDIGPIRADSGQIEQIILNLVINARDAMPDGGRITVSTRGANLTDPASLPHPALNPGQYVVLAVADTGSGMDKETQTRIFEPFFTTKEVGKGTGLGLSTVYGIVQQTGGHISVQSEPGRGTVFSLYVPVVGRAVDAPATDARPGPVAPGSETILLIEDDESVRTLSKVALQKVGYRVLDAGNAEEALKICEDYLAPIHLVLTDIVMPGVNGPKLVECLLSARENMKVLFMSGYTDDSLVRLKLAAGAPFLQKPFAPAKLAEKVREILDGTAEGPEHQTGDARRTENSRIGGHPRDEREQSHPAAKSF